MKVLYGQMMNKEEVKRQRKAGEKLSEVILCPEILFHRYFFCSVYIRYRDIRQLYLRIESGESGDLSVSENSLVVVDAGGREYSLHVDRKEFAEEAMKKLSVKYPHIIIGKTPTRKK